MCDTLGMINKKDGRVYFAKNSDRSPNEVQVLEYHPARRGLSGTLDVTYMSLPQAEETHAVLLSRPAWMWGAEMGINDCGLCIGNEAVFTKGAYGKTGLTGMDMVRLALERCSRAAEARDLIIDFLQKYGQGGNCGYDHKFYYDNAFLIMDCSEIFVLETAGKKWVWKAYDKASISNRLSIGSEGDGYSGTGKAYDFFRRHMEPVYSFFSGSARRRAQTQCSLGTAENTADFMKALRVHDEGVDNPFSCGSVSSTCMHYGGMVGDHTTSSMVICLDPKNMDKTIVWSTGTSCPCVSLFKPWLFGSDAVAPVFAKQDVDSADAPQEAREYWLKAEKFRRSLIGKCLPEEFYEERDGIEARWIKEAAETDSRDFTAFSQKCLEEEAAFYDKWQKKTILDAPSVSSAFMKRWHKKNEALEEV